MQERLLPRGYQNTVGYVWYAKHFCQCFVQLQSAI